MRNISVESLYCLPPLGSLSAMLRRSIVADFKCIIVTRGRYDLDLNVLVYQSDVALLGSKLKDKLCYGVYDFIRPHC